MARRAPRAGTGVKGGGSCDERRDGNPPLFAERYEGPANAGKIIFSAGKDYSVFSLGGGGGSASMSLSGVGMSWLAVLLANL